MPTARFFNTEGPNRAEDHDTLPPLARWDLDEILTLIDRNTAHEPGSLSALRAGGGGGAGHCAEGVARRTPGSPRMFGAFPLSCSGVIFNRPAQSGQIQPPRNKEEEPCWMSTYHARA